MVKLHNHQSNNRSMAIHTRLSQQRTKPHIHQRNKQTMAITYISISFCQNDYVQLIKKSVTDFFNQCYSLTHHQFRMYNH